MPRDNRKDVREHQALGFASSGHLDKPSKVSELGVIGYNEGCFMKPFVLLFAFFCALAANAQSTNAPETRLPLTNSTPSKTGQSLEVQTGSGGFSSFEFTEIKPNEVIKGTHIYSGIAVEAVKKRRPFQLINPLAGPEYGSPED